MSFKKESKNWKPNLRQKMIKRRNIYQRPKIIRLATKRKQKKKQPMKFKSGKKILP